jgi:hypothetical protein
MLLGYDSEAAADSSNSALDLTAANIASQQYQSNLLGNSLQSMMRKQQLLQRRAAVMAAAAAINPPKSQYVDRGFEQQQKQSHLHDVQQEPSQQDQQKTYKEQRALTLNLAEAIANYRNAQQQHFEPANGGSMLHSQSATSGLQTNSDSMRPIGAMRRGGWRRVSKTTSFLGNNVSDCIQKCVLQGVLHPVQCHSLC